MPDGVSISRMGGGRHPQRMRVLSPIGGVTGMTSGITGKFTAMVNALHRLARRRDTHRTSHRGLARHGAVQKLGTCGLNKFRIFPPVSENSGGLRNFLG